MDGPSLPNKWCPVEESYKGQCFHWLCSIQGKQGSGRRRLVSSPLLPSVRCKWEIQRLATTEKMCPCWSIQLPTSLAEGTSLHPGSGLRAPPGGSAAEPPASPPGQPARPTTVPTGFQKSLPPVCFKIDAVLHYTTFDLHTHYYATVQVCALTGAD